MTHVYLKRGLLLAALSSILFLATGPTPSAYANPPTANAGTLTCIVSPGEKEPFGVERKLSCNFKPITGPKIDFVGVVKKLGAEVPSDHKVVLAWSVLAPASQVSAEMLAGVYTGVISSDVKQPDKTRFSATLVGGKNSEISLRALNASTAEGAKSTLAVVELELSSMKV